MAFSNFEQAIGVVLKHEGGLVNNPNDPGGITNFGVSMKFVLAELAGQKGPDGYDLGDFNHDGKVDADDIKQMSVHDAMNVYKVAWWDKFHYELIENQTLATKVLDASVNMGATQTHKLLQRACNAVGATPALQDDGVLGSKTFSVINSIDSGKIVAALSDQMKKFYDQIIAKNPKLETFRKGWYKRSTWPI